MQLASPPPPTRAALCRAGIRNPAGFGPRARAAPPIFLPAPLGAAAPRKGAAVADKGALCSFVPSLGAQGVLPPRAACHAARAPPGGRLHAAPNSPGLASRREKLFWPAGCLVMLLGAGGTRPPATLRHRSPAAQLRAESPISDLHPVWLPEGERALPSISRGFKGMGWGGVGCSRPWEQ